MSGDDAKWEPGAELEDTSSKPASTAAGKKRSAKAQSDGGGKDGEPKAETKQQPLTFYEDFQSWMLNFFAPTVRRQLGGQHAWCARWYRHAEAVSRLVCLWHEWEKARADGTISSWWLVHADPHLAVLLSRDAGPFASCKPDKHQELQPLPLGEADPKLWLGPAYSDPPGSRRPAQPPAP